MNMQAIMQQAKKMQNDMLKTKEEIDNRVFEASSSFVSVKVNGKKDVLEIKIDNESIESDEIEMLQDMLVVALNQAYKKVDEYTDEKMAKYNSMMPGLF